MTHRESQNGTGCNAIRMDLNVDHICSRNQVLPSVILNQDPLTMGEFIVQSVKMVDWVRSVVLKLAAG